MNRFLVLCVLAAVSGSISAADYCSKDLCGKRQHIACGNSGNFASKCTNPSLVSLSAAQKDAVVKAHNVNRNLIAGGQNSRYQRACRMATMQWDEELASLAALNVKQCEMRHDSCHNTNAFSFSGQNLAWMTFYNSPDIDQMLKGAVDMWFSEHKHSNMNHINRYPSSYSGPAIGHFTVMMADRNVRVGCAASTYAVQGDDYKAFLMACNYATTNMLDFPIYKSCSTAASECKKGKNPQFTNLCSTSEVYDVNKWF